MYNDFSCGMTEREFYNLIEVQEHAKNVLDVQAYDYISGGTAAGSWPCHFVIAVLV